MYFLLDKFGIIIGFLLSFILIIILIFVYGMMRRWKDEEFVSGILSAISWYIITFVLSIVFPNIGVLLRENKELYFIISIIVIEISVAILKKRFI